MIAYGEIILPIIFIYSLKAGGRNLQSYIAVGKTCQIHNCIINCFNYICDKAMKEEHRKL